MRDSVAPGLVERSCKVGDPLLDVFARAEDLVERSAGAVSSVVSDVRAGLVAGSE